MNKTKAHNNNTIQLPLQSEPIQNLKPLMLPKLEQLKGKSKDKHYNTNTHCTCIITNTWCP